MNIWNQDNSIKAWNFASQAHKGQNVPGIVIGFRFVLAQLLRIGKKLDIKRKTIIIKEKLRASCNYQQMEISYINQVFSKNLISKKVPDGKVPN